VGRPIAAPVHGETPMHPATRPLRAVFYFVKLIGDTYLAVFQTAAQLGRHKVTIP